MRASRRASTAPCYHEDDGSDSDGGSPAAGKGIEHRQWQAGGHQGYYGSEPPSWQAERRGPKGSDPAAGGSGWGDGAGGSAGGGGGSSAGGGGSGGAAHSLVLEDWEEAELALLSPESQKRERRRIANRDCARRIRLRKTELLSELSTSVQSLQADSSRLQATLTGGRWHFPLLKLRRPRSQTSGSAVFALFPHPIAAPPHPAHPPALLPCAPAAPTSPACAEVTRCWRDTSIENCELRSQLALLEARQSGAGGSGAGGGGVSVSQLSSPVGLARQLRSPGGWPSPMLL